LTSDPLDVSAVCDDHRDQVKTISGAGLLLALGFVAAGCASGSKARAGTQTVAGRKVFSSSITVSGTTTIANPRTGMVVQCRGSQLTATVPGRSVGVLEAGRSSDAAGRKTCG
jgi:hypothetical protein